MTPQSAREWALVVPIGLGALLLVFCAVVWLFTDRLEPLLVTTAGTLLTIGYGGQAIQAAKAPPPAPPLPPSDESDGDA